MRKFWNFLDDNAVTIDGVLTTFGLGLIFFGCLGVVCCVVWQL